MLTNFSPDAQQTLSLARKEADRLEHDFVGTGHLLLGLLRVEDGGARDMFAHLGVASRETIREEVERLLAASFDQTEQGFIPYTPRMRHAMVLAGREAHHFHHAHVGSEHLLLGVFQENDGAGAIALRNLGFTLEALRGELVRIAPALQVA